MDLKIDVYMKIQENNMLAENYLTNAINENRRCRYNTQKEEAYREIYAMMYKLNHYRKFRKTLVNADFRLRNLAVRSGVIRYEYCGVNFDNMYEVTIDEPKLCVLISHCRPLFVKDEARVKQQPDESITIINERQNSRIYEEPVFNVVYNAYSHNYYVEYGCGVRDDVDYVVIPDEDEGEEQLAVAEYELRRGHKTILDYTIAEIRDCITYDIKTYSEVQEDYQPEEDAYESENCPVCYEEWGEDVEQKFFTCKHSMCNNCINHLRTRHCPMCREPIVIKTNIVDVDRTDEELQNLMRQETADEICDTWFDDINELVDHLGFDNIIGSDDEESIELSDYVDFTNMYSVSMRCNRFQVYSRY